MGDALHIEWLGPVLACILCRRDGVITLSDMPTTYELSCPPFKIRVNKLEHGGWVAAVEMSLSKLVLSPPWLTVDQAKDDGIVLAKALCQVDIPAACLDDPNQWKEVK